MGNSVLSGILGLAVGDALGVPVEFMGRDGLRANPVTGMRAYGTHMQPAGTWSDDTSLTLCLMASVAEKSFIDYEDIMRRFASWLNRGELAARGKAFDIGTTTRAAIRCHLSGKSALACGGAQERACGNGSLMRILPAAYLIAGKAKNASEVAWEELSLVHDISRLTHAHPVCFVACGIYVLVAVNLLSGMGKEEAVADGIARARSLYEAREEFAPALFKFARLANVRELSEEDIKSDGYVVHTLLAALWCLITTETYRACVLRAVNLGEDTDTTAAVAGGLAGIYYGLSGIPADWLAALAKREEIEALCGAYRPNIGA